MRKKKEYKPGWSRPDAVAWCDFHNRGMNYRYIRRKFCLCRRNRGICKHLKWFPAETEKEAKKK